VPHENQEISIISSAFFYSFSTMIASKFLKPSQAFTFAFWFNGTVSVRYALVLPFLIPSHRPQNM
jgi:hypothetical protein